MPKVYRKNARTMKVAISFRVRFAPGLKVEPLVPLTKSYQHNGSTRQIN